LNGRDTESRKGNEANMGTGGRSLAQGGVKILRGEFCVHKHMGKLGVL